MIRFPNNSLDPDSQPWARQVEQEIRGLSQSLASDSTLQKNTAGGMAATLRKMSDQIETLNTVVTDLTTQQAALAAQVSYTNSLITRDMSLGDFNSGAIGSGYAWVGDEIVITLPVSTGKLRVWTFINQLTLSVTSGSLAAGISYAVDGLHSLDAGSRACSMYSSIPGLIASSISRVGHITVTPGSTVTFRARSYVWGAGAGSAQFSAPRALVEVVNPN